MRRMLGRQKITSDLCFGIDARDRFRFRRVLRRAARLRQSILKQVFEGKLVPQDPTDEPASVLLKRLRAKQVIQEGNGNADTPARTRGRRVKSKMTERRADQ